MNSFDLEGSLDVDIESNVKKDKWKKYCFDLI